MASPWGKKGRSAVERVLARLIVDDDGCWIWLGTRSVLGYGQVWVLAEQRTVPTHRVTYEAFVGTVPDGLELDHLCRRPSCCNPAHLEPVTHQENCRRGAAARDTGRCPQGHLYDEKNTGYYVRRGKPKRRCMECHRQRERVRREAKRQILEGRVGA